VHFRVFWWFNLVFILLLKPRALHISDQNISVHPKKIHVHISVFGKPQIHVHYCIDRDTIQRKKRAKRGCHLRRQPQKLEIAKLVAPRREHFRSFVAIFVVYLFSQKTGVFMDRNVQQWF